MTILYIGYWSFENNLTKAAIFPHLKILSTFTQVKKIILITLEREMRIKNRNSVLPDKVELVQLYSGKSIFSLFNLFRDHIRYISDVRRIIREEGIDMILANGTQAGTIALRARNKVGIPLIIEYFEPHAEYMADNKVWGRFDPRYLYLKNQEKKQKKYAEKLITVSRKYKHKLIENGLNQKKLATSPCPVDKVVYNFNPGKRREIRRQLRISDDYIVGIYTGKFGDLYWDGRAFQLFAYCQRFFKDQFFLMILTPQDIESVKRKLLQNQIDVNRVHVENGAYESVPDFLSGADYAFSLPNTNPSSVGCAPIKDGEYWASGLPTVITEDIGDDSDIILENSAGAVISEKVASWEIAMIKIKKILLIEKHRENIRELAINYRSIDIITSIYRQILEEEYMN